MDRDAVGPLDVLAFLLELAALVAVGEAGFTLDAGWGVRILIGLGGLLAMIVLWALFGARHARIRMPDNAVHLFRAGWFLAAAAALAAARHPVLGAALWLVWLVDYAALHRRRAPRD